MERELHLVAESEHPLPIMTPWLHLESRASKSTHTERGGLRHACNWCDLEPPKIEAKEIESWFFKQLVECLNSSPSHPVLMMAKTSAKTVGYVEKLMN